MCSCATAGPTFLCPSVAARLPNHIRMVFCFLNCQPNQALSPPPPLTAHMILARFLGDTHIRLAPSRCFCEIFAIRKREGKYYMWFSFYTPPQESRTTFSQNKSIQKKKIEKEKVCMQHSFLSKDRHPMYDVFQPDIGHAASGPPFHTAYLTLLHGMQTCKSLGSSLCHVIICL